MAKNSLGKHSFVPGDKAVLTAWASVAGKKEAQGPLGACFDITQNDPYFGQKTWEQAERKMQQLALQTLAEKSGMQMQDFDVVCSGDLLNQCISSSFPLRNTGISHLGLYGACSTMAESLLIAGMCVGGGYRDNIVAMTSSHFASSERQYRFPLGYGGQRTPTAQWTVTGAGAVLVTSSGDGPTIEGCTIGTVTDLGIKDANNMGAAMAPAAYDTLQAHFRDTGRTPAYYDLVVTGDLGKLGSEILRDFFQQDGTKLTNHNDCGLLLFDLVHQDVHCGGSGCGCSAAVLTGYLMRGLKNGTWKKILFCPTGALLSPTSTMQKESIPSICHAISIEA